MLSAIPPSGVQAGVHTGSSPVGVKRIPKAAVRERVAVPGGRKLMNDNRFEDLGRVGAIGSFQKMATHGKAHAAVPLSSRSIDEAVHRVVRMEIKCFLSSGSLVSTTCQTKAASTPK